MDATKEKSNAKKIFGIVSEAAQLVIILALVVVSALTFGSRIPVLAKWGLNFFAVTSGSMEPTIPTGSIILDEKVEPADLKKDDIITFQKINPETDQPSIVTHRIVGVKVIEREVQATESAEPKIVRAYEISTKGDANSSLDPYTVSAGEVIGRYKWHIPNVGYITSFIQTPKGFISLVIIPGLILIIWETVSLTIYLKDYMSKRKQAKEKND